MSYRYGLLLTVAATVSVVAGCTSAPAVHLSASALRAAADGCPEVDGPVTPAGQREALKWLRAHPVPRRPRVVAAIEIEDISRGCAPTFLGPESTMWLTASGKIITQTCGNLRTGAYCPLQKGEVDEASDSLPVNGQYVYVAADGDGNSPSDYRLIRASTIRLPQPCGGDEPLSAKPARGELCWSDSSGTLHPLVTP